MRNTEPIIKEVIIDAPVKKVWAALTEKEQFGKWFLPAEELKPEVGTTFHMTGYFEGKAYPHVCTVTEVIPEKKIAYTWEIEGDLGETLVTYELEQTGDKTKVTMTHSGFDKYPFDAPQESRDGYANGWEKIINVYLKDYVEKGVEQHQ